MRAVGILLIGTWLLAGCSQVVDQFYSKKNFNMQSFNADISECHGQKPSFVAEQRVRSSTTSNPISQCYIERTTMDRGPL